MDSDRRKPGPKINHIRDQEIADLVISKARHGQSLPQVAREHRIDPGHLWRILLRTGRISEYKLLRQEHKLRRLEHEYRFQRNKLLHCILPSPKIDQT